MGKGGDSDVFLPSRIGCVRRGFSEVTGEESTKYEFNVDYFSISSCLVCRP